MLDFFSKIYTILIVKVECFYTNKLMCDLFFPKGKKKIIQTNIPHLWH